MSQPDVHVIKPDPLVWKAALKEAGGDVSRLRIVSETEVLIENHGRHGRRSDRAARSTQLPDQS